MGRKSERALAVTARKCAQMTTSRDSARSNDVRVSWLEQGMDAPCPPCRISPARGLLLRGADAPARSPARGGRPCAADPFWWGHRIRDGCAATLPAACTHKAGWLDSNQVYIGPEFRPWPNQAGSLTETGIQTVYNTGTECNNGIIKTFQPLCTGGGMSNYITKVNLL